MCVSVTVKLESWTTSPAFRTCPVSSPFSMEIIESSGIVARSGNERLVWVVIPDAVLGLLKL